MAVSFGRHRGKRYRLTVDGIRYCERLIPGLLRALRAEHGPSRLAQCYPRSKEKAMERLDRETVHEIIDLAERCFAEHPSWDPEMSLDELKALMTRKESLALIERLRALSRDELDELQALMWLGREGGTAEDWDGWLRDARTYRGTPEYVAEKKPLAKYLRAGLRALDRDGR